MSLADTRRPEDRHARAADRLDCREPRTKLVGDLAYRLLEVGLLAL